MTRHLAISDAADWSQFKRIIREILLALQSLTERGVVHCDLKRNNILIHEPSGAIALADFGPSRNATDEHDQIERTTLPYQAPEVFLWNHYSHASDIWAVGCIFMELFFGKILFRPKHMLDWNQASTLIPQLWLNNLGPPPDWLADALRFYPVDRQKARHGLRDSLNDEPLFNNFIHGFFRWHPKERTTVEQALKHPFFASSDSEIVSR
jgi:serine/threonine protein kinase